MYLIFSSKIEIVLHVLTFRKIIRIFLDRLIIIEYLKTGFIAIIIKQLRLLLLLTELHDLSHELFVKSICNSMFSYE